MSEYIKLKKEFDEHIAKVSKKAFCTFVTKIGNLQSECKHERTHWIQEIDTDGSLSTELRKRCYVCGAVIDTLKLDNEELELILKRYDDMIEDRNNLHKFIEKYTNSKEKLNTDSGCPCGEESESNCEYCQDLPRGYFANRKREDELRKQDELRTQSEKK